MESHNYIQDEEFLEDPPPTNSSGEARQVQVEEIPEGDTEIYVGLVEASYYRAENGQLYYVEEDDELDLIEGDIQGVIDESDAVYVNESSEYQHVADAKPEFKQQEIVHSDDETGRTGIFVSQVPPPTVKRRKNRQFGGCKCPECDQTFINQTRLERHLAVHQIFGSFLCPLCGKTFKYEYNLFYHWRKTCRDLQDMIPVDDRQEMDVNNLRLMVEDLAQKKPEIGPINIGISSSVLFQNGPASRLDVPTNLLGRRGTACNSCGVLVPTGHAKRHAALHRSDTKLRPDELSIAGGYFCDLCGIVYRNQQNLFKHWRTSCPEIQANLPASELVLDDEGLVNMVSSLLQRVQIRNKNFPNPFEAVPVENHEDDPEPTSSRRADEKEIVVDDDGYPNTSTRQAYDGRDPGIIFADDFGADECMIIGTDGKTHVARSDRSKWKVPEKSLGTGKQCPECSRVFANQGRLDRHMMGFHSNFGCHICVLCGNRFKYEYNLLYHYRKSCPYTKAYVERSMREALCAADLRNTVQRLATKKIPIKMQLRPEYSGMQAMHLKKLEAAKKSARTMPRQLLQIRPELSRREPQRCPICEVVFYGVSNLDRHIQTAHDIVPSTLRAIQQADNETMQLTSKMPDEADEEHVIDDTFEPPPKLERQEPAPESGDNVVHYRFVDQNSVDITNFDTNTLNTIRNFVEANSLRQNDGFLIEGNDGLMYTLELVDTFDNAEGEKTVVLNIELHVEKPNHVVHEIDGNHIVYEDDGILTAQDAVILEEVVDVSMPLDDAT